MQKPSKASRAQELLGGGVLSVNAPHTNPGSGYDPAAAHGLSSNPQTEAKPSPGLLLGPPGSPNPTPSPDVAPSSCALALALTVPSSRDTPHSLPFQALLKGHLLRTTSLPSLRHTDSFTQFSRVFITFSHGLSVVCAQPPLSAAPGGSRLSRNHSPLSLVRAPRISQG